MPFYRSIRSRRGRKRISGPVELQLTSMMDVLVILVVFLLKSYAATTNSFSTVPGLKMPVSLSKDNPPDSLQVIVTPEGITFENERILDFVQSAGNAGSADGSYVFKAADLTEGSRKIIPLYDALIKAKNRAEFLRAKSKARDANGQPLPFDGVLAIQADKRVQYDIIRKIMFTAGSAGYKIFRFLAIHREG